MAGVEVAMMLLTVVLAIVGQADRPTEADMFGGESDAGSPQPRSERPSEDAMFGGDNSAPAAEAAQAVQPDGGPSDRDFTMLGPATGKSRFDTDEEKTDPLKVGGTLYLRAQAYVSESQQFKNTAFSSPDLLDVYLDARPNDRVRGVAVGRLLYEPTRAPGTPSGFAGFGLSTVQAPQANPSVFLDQLYLRFDIARTVFVTAGRQKVKWGTAHIWNPTDALNPQRRDPFQPFDLRLGVNAVKFHFPIESLGWNFYAYGLLDNAEPANTLGKLGGALRAEIVIPKVRAEIGLDGAWVAGRRPRYGLDLSMPLPDPIPVDIFAEVAFRDGRDFVKWTVEGDFDADQPFSARVHGARGSGVIAQVAAGLSTSFPVGEQNLATVGLEYFYNPMGVSQPIYPLLYGQGDLCAMGFDVQCDLQAEYTPFYAAQHYAAAFLLFPGLPRLNWVSLNFTGLMNITDLSVMVRLDVFVRVLQFLSVEAFGALNLGTRGGELRPGYDVVTPGFELHVPAPAGSFGLGLRLNI